MFLQEILYFHLYMNKQKKQTVNMGVFYLLVYLFRDIVTVANKFQQYAIHS
jgi:hypothetical protein